MVESLDLTKLDQLESILKTLNKFCYFSIKLCIEAFNSGLIGVIDKLITVLESPIGKGNPID